MLRLLRGRLTELNGVNMAKAFGVVFLLALASCSSVAQHQPQTPCAIDEASYACQIERYQNVAA
jgi:hypothetical protein